MIAWLLSINFMKGLPIIKHLVTLQSLNVKLKIII